MKFRCQTTDLVAALTIAAHALSARTTIPILEGILVEAEGERLTLTCTDGGMTIVTNLPAEIEEDGRVVLPGRLFTEIIRKLPAAPVEGSLNERDVITFKCLGSRTTLAGMSASFFPERPKVEAEYFLELPQPLIKEMIRQTSFAVSTDEARKILTGALLEVNNGELRMVATDGFQMAIRTALIPTTTPTLSAVIPGRFLQEIGKVMSDDEEQTATFMFGDNQLMITAGETTIYTSLLTGEFINYRNILPTDWTTILTVNRENLSMCVDRASLMAREGKNNIIKFSIAEENVTITSNSERGDVLEELPVIQEGVDLDIGFNVRYVTDALRAIADETILMNFVSSIRPCVLRPIEGESFTYVLLPVRLNV